MGIQYTLSADIINGSDPKQIPNSQTYLSITARQAASDKWRKMATDKDSLMYILNTDADDMTDVDWRIKFTVLDGMTETEHRHEFRNCFSNRKAGLFLAIQL